MHGDDYMKIGKMRNRITIKSVENVIDDAGFTTKNESIFSTVWTEMIQISSKEIYTNSADNLQNVFKFRIRYLKGITTDMEVEFEGKNYNIKGILDINMRFRELILICEVIQNV